MIEIDEKLNISKSFENRIEIDEKLNISKSFENTIIAI